MYIVVVENKRNKLYTDSFFYEEEKDAEAFCKRIAENGYVAKLFKHIKTLKQSTPIIEEVV